MGCRLVVVLGATTQIDNYLRMRGLDTKHVKGYRITDEDAMLAAMEAAGAARMLVEAQLSKVIAPAFCMSQLACRYPIQSAMAHVCTARQGGLCRYLQMTMHDMHQSAPCHHILAAWSDSCSKRSASMQ